MANVTAVLICAALAVLLVLREVSARRAMAHLRKELAEARAHTSDHDQMATVGHLLSGLAQDLKSPLQGVIGNTELMLASADPGHASAAELHEIRDNAARAAGIVRNLIAFTETSALTRRWFDINDIVARAVERCRAELQTAGVRVQVVRADRLPLIWVDGRQIEKVIATLLTLPVSMAPLGDGAPESVLLMIETRRGTGPEDPLVIEIDDRISEDGADEASWSGGLAACRRIIEAHAGSLEVNSRAGAGFRFHVELPVAAAGVETEFATQE